MSDFMKKQSIGFYLNVIAVIAGIAGLVATSISSTMETAYAYNGFGLLVAGVIAGIALCIVAIYAPNRNGNHDLVSTISVVAAIGVFAAVIGKIILERVLLISGLFSYNAGNMIGWKVFYVTVAAIVCLLVAILALIIGSFTKSVKEA